MKPSGISSATAQGATEFLRAHEKMAALLPAAKRMAALQKECHALLPAMFSDCSILKFEAGHLVLSVPNAALAARLKQQMPQLQLSLMKRGWQVNSIQTKVQVKEKAEKSVHCKKVLLSPQALQSLSALNNSLESTPTNAALKTALSTMIKRHQTQSS